MRARGGIVAVVGATLGLGVGVGSAQAERPFAQRFSQNAQGDVVIAANTALSCIEVESSCPAVRAGTGPAASLNNNAAVMSYVDVDAEADTFDSSSADLALPGSGRVLFAGLYWGARTKAGIGGAAAPDPSARGRVRLRVPGSEAYTSVSASQIDEASDTYQGFADVTDLVGRAGGGTYTVADLQAGTGRNDGQLAGWSLVVAYGDPAQPPRNLAVFDGLRNVGTTLPTPVAVDLSGFRTPTTGPVRSKVGIVAYEGDLGTTGDGATLAGPSGDVGLPQGATSNNLFRSAIATGGNARNPNDTNQLGFDASELSTTNLLGNAQTATTVKLSTRGDAYQPGVVTLATDLFAPRIEATKTVDRATADLGDELTYTTTIANTGQDAATGVAFDDTLPAGVTPVPDTLTVDGVPQPDPTGDALDLGTLAPGDRRVVAFRVRVADDGLRTGTVLENVASVAFTAQDLGTRDRVVTAPARTAVRVPNVAIGKAHSPALVAGGTSTYTIAVRNDGDAATRGPVVVHDTLDAAFTATAAPSGAGWTCTGTRDITCARTDALAPGATYPPIAIPVRVAADVTPGSLANTARVDATPDGDPGDDEVTDAGAVSTPDVDLALTKATTSTPQFDPTRYVPGEEVVFTLGVRNDGPDAAPAVAVVDTLPPSLVGGSGDGPDGPCATPDARTVRCELGTLAAGDRATVTVRGRLADTLPPYPPDSVETNTARVETSAQDLDPTDDEASSTFATVPVTDLAVTKAFAPARPAAGGRVTYTMVVRNNGPAVVDVLVADLTPEALTDVTVDIGGPTGACAIEPFTGFPRDLPQCLIPQLEVGGARTVTVTGRLPADSAGTPITNVAAVSAAAAEEDFSNNRAEVTFTPGRSDVALDKTVDAAAPHVGDIITYDLTARATGDADAQDVVVTDPLPAGLTVAAPLPDGCAADGTVVTCRADDLAAGAQRTFAVRTQVGDAAAGTHVVNRATVASDAGGAASAEAATDVAPAPAAPATSATPVGPPTAIGVAGQSAPAVAVACASRRSFTIRVRGRRGRRLRSARITVDGRAVTVRRRADGHWVATVDLRGRPKQTVRVSVRATLRGGRTLRWTRVYRTCTAKQPAANHLDDPRAL